MGDYVIFVNEKCVITACDNLAYVKKLLCIEALMADAEIGIPYSGAKEAYKLDLSNRSAALKVVARLWNVLPFPKNKIKKNIWLCLLQFLYIIWLIFLLGYKLAI